jgi:uncharacterized coiled-coil protein SlyX
MFRKTNQIASITSLKDVVAQQHRIFDTLAKLSAKLNIVSNNVTSHYDKQCYYTETLVYNAMDLRKNIINLEDRFIAQAATLRAFQKKIDALEKELESYKTTHKHTHTDNRIL